MKLKCVGINTAIKIEADMSITVLKYLELLLYCILFLCVASFFYCMYVCTYVFMYVYVLLYIYIYGCMYASVWVCACMSSYLCVYVCTHVHNGVLFCFLSQ
jgi:hypothetical protein